MQELSQSPKLNLPLTTSEEWIPLNIRFNKEFDIFLIKGPSTKPNINITYSVILDEIKEHLTENKRLTVILKFIKINYNTSVFMLELIELFNHSLSNGCIVDIHWHTVTSDKTLLNYGLQYQTLADFTFSVNTRMKKDIENTKC